VKIEQMEVRTRYKGGVALKAGGDGIFRSR
jgi:hypothetical protein